MRANILSATVAASIAFATPAASQVFQDDSASVLTDAERRALTASLARELADPMSAQIRELAVPTMNDKPMNDRFVCGLVNAKNRFGAYVGFRPFSFDRRDGRVSITEPLSKTHPAYELSVMAYNFTNCFMVHSYQ